MCYPGAPDGNYPDVYVFWLNSTDEILPHTYTYTIRSIWRHKDSMVGQQSLERTEDDDESQGRKALRIHRPCLGSVCAQRRHFCSAPPQINKALICYPRAREFCLFVFWKRPESRIMSLCAREARENLLSDVKKTSAWAHRMAMRDLRQKGLLD